MVGAHGSQLKLKQMAKKTTTKPKAAATPKADTKHEEVKKEVKTVVLDKTKVYDFKSNGVAPSMKKDQVFKITGAMAEIFIKVGYGKIV